MASHWNDAELGRDAGSSISFSSTPLGRMVRFLGGAMPAAVTDAATEALTQVT